MNKLDFPALSIQYCELNVYAFRLSNDVTNNNIVNIVAPDSHIAISVFGRLFPSREFEQFICVGSCISVYPDFDF